MGGDLIVSCFIDSEKKTILYQTNATNGSSSMSLERTQINDETRDFILKANRWFLLEANRRGSAMKGCLPLQCLTRSTSDSDTYICPRYLINVFIRLMELLLSDKCHTEIFHRDANVEVPATNDGLKDMFKELMDYRPSMPMPEQNAPPELISFNGLLTYLMSQMASVETYLTKKIEKCQKSKRGANIVGGSSVKPSKEGCLIDEIVQQMGDSKSYVHEVIRENKASILQHCMRGNQNFNRALLLISEQPMVSIYENQNITLSLMFDCLEEIFEIIFMKVLPRMSMTLAMAGSIYYATFLKELKLLEFHRDQLQIPITLRLMFSCFPERNIQLSSNAETYIRDLYPYIYKEINNVNNCITEKDTDNVNNMKNYDTSSKCSDPVNMKRLNFTEEERLNLNFIIRAAKKFHLQDESYTNYLYELLNVKRGRLYEYYLISILGLYFNCICPSQGITNRNRDSNGERFILPLFIILTKFYRYMNKLRNDIFNMDGSIDIKFIMDIIDGFSFQHSEDLKICCNAIMEFVGDLIGKRVITA